MALVVVVVVVASGCEDCGASADVVGCRGLEVRCGDRCVDVESDDDNCGVCGDVCKDDERCTGGRCNARCVNPRLDLDGTVVGTFPELVGCQASRFDVDGDGSIDDVCGGFRVVTEPEFAIEAAGVDPPGFGSADLAPTPGLEQIGGCRVVDEEFATLISFDPPCDLAGNGVADVDDDGDFDVVLKDGRVFEHTDDGLVAGAPLPPLPGPMARFRFDDGAALVSWSRERSALVRFVDGVWVDVGVLDVGYDVIELIVIDDGAAQTLVAWQGSGVVPNLALCAWRDGFDCRLASSSTNLIASPPRDGAFISGSMGAVVAADAAEVGFGVPFVASPTFVRDRSLVAMDQQQAWFVTAATGAVVRHALQPVMAMPVSTRVHQGDDVVDVGIEAGGIVVGTDVIPLPTAGTADDVLAHPTLPVLWIAVTLFPSRGAAVVALDVDRSAVLSVTDLVQDGPLQLVDVDGDGALELLAGRAPTLVFDAATGALREQRDAFERYVDVGGVLATTAEPPIVTLDLDGDGVADDVTPTVGTTNTVIATESGVVDLGYTNVVFAGPGRRQVSIFSETVGAMTWNLLCD